MWIYEKKLEFPVHIKEPNPKLAQLIISQYGGPISRRPGPLETLVSPTE